MDRRLLKNFDFTLLAATLALIAYGCAMIYSASKGGQAGAGFVQRQIVWACLGLVSAAVVASIHHSLYHRYAGKLYFLTLCLLVAVLVVGEESKGAQRWIGLGAFQMQPSEFAKVLLIVALAIFFVNRRDRMGEFSTFLLSFLYLAVPTALIFKQPDLGTSLVLVAIWVTMAFVAGARIGHLALFATGVVILGLAAWYTPGVMKDYQKNRLITFVNPAADPRDTGYHVNQSRIAIGSGQLFGKGFLKGTQRQLSFIPEQHTDFIVTVVGEEFGFVGTAALLGLFFLLLWRAIDIMALSEDVTGRVIAAGVVGLFLFHIVVNIGMTVGIMPVTGLPLPLFSYGGSSMIANMMALGLLQGISMRRHRITF